MASTVIGLFEQRSDAEAALNDLVNNGFSSSDIDLKAPGASSDESLIRELEGEGVPADDARLYIEGVKAGDALEIAHTSNDRAMLAQEIMNRHGALDVHDAFTQRSGTLTTDATDTAGAGLPGAGTAADSTATSGTTSTTGTVNAGGETVIPVVEEELTVGKRQIQRGGVRVFQRVEERPVEEQVTLHEEHVTVQRQAVDRPVTSADTAFREGTIEVTETAEVPVVSKEARVVEEVVVGKTATNRTETVQDTVRRTDVEVEEIPGTAVTDTTTTHQI